MLLSTRTPACQPAPATARRQRAASLVAAAVPEHNSSRRVLLSTLALAPALQLLAPALVGAAEERYTDDAERFSIAVPSGWERAEGVATGAIGTRKVSLWCGSLSYQRQTEQSLDACHALRHTLWSSAPMTGPLLLRSGPVRPIPHLLSYAPLLLTQACVWGPGDQRCGRVRALFAAPALTKSLSQ